MGGGKYQRLNHKSLRMPEEDRAFDVHHPYLQMRNLMHRWEVIASRLLSTLVAALLVWYGSHKPHIAIEHLKCDGGTEF